MIRMYKKQREIYNNILKHCNKNHIIVNSNGVGVSFILKNIVENLSKYTDRKIYIHGLCTELKESFKDLTYETITFSDKEKLDNNSSIIAFNCIEKDLEEYAMSIGCAVIRNSTPCIYPDLNKYHYTYFLNAFDTPNFKNISLEDIVNNTYISKMKNNFYTKYLINPDDARKIFDDNIWCGGIDSYEFRTRVLGLMEKI